MQRSLNILCCGRDLWSFTDHAEWTCVERARDRLHLFRAGQLGLNWLQVVNLFPDHLTGQALGRAGWALGSSGKLGMCCRAGLTRYFLGFLEMSISGALRTGFVGSQAVKRVELPAPWDSPGFPLWDTSRDARAHSEGLKLSIPALNYDSVAIKKEDRIQPSAHSVCFGSRVSVLPFFERKEKQYNTSKMQILKKWWF